MHGGTHALPAPVRVHLCLQQLFFVHVALPRAYIPFVHVPTFPLCTCLHSLCARAYIPSAGDIPPSARVPFKVELTNLRISSSLMSACKATCQKCQCIVRKWISSSLMFSLREPGRGLTLYLYIYDTGILYDGTTWTFLLYIIFMYVYI